VKVIGQEYAANTGKNNSPEWVAQSGWLVIDNNGN
jgi:hypothetical protein